MVRNSAIKHNPELNLTLLQYVNAKQSWQVHGENSKPLPLMELKQSHIKHHVVFRYEILDEYGEIRKAEEKG